MDRAAADAVAEQSREASTFEQSGDLSLRMPDEWIVQATGRSRSSVINL